MWKPQRFPATMRRTETREWISVPLFEDGFLPGPVLTMEKRNGKPHAFSVRDSESMKDWFRVHVGTDTTPGAMTLPVLHDALGRLIEAAEAEESSPQSAGG